MKRVTLICFGLFLMGIGGGAVAQAQATATAEGDSVSLFRVKSHGTISLGVTNNILYDDHPALPAHLRRRSYVDLTQQINIQAEATLRDKLYLQLKYNTETMRASDRYRINLGYRGAESELVQSLEVGNIRMRSRNPLLFLGGEELFGVQGHFRLGAVELMLLAARQRGEERRIVLQRGERVQFQEIKSSQYDFARHFFLSTAFADKYDEALRQLPIITSDSYVERVAVWVVSPRKVGGRQLTEEVTAVGSEGEHTVHPHARRLSSAEYTLHPTLGFVSLHAPLGQSDQLLVAYEYQEYGRHHQVGSLDGSLEAVVLADRDKSPASPYWHLMMKNGYTLSTLPAEWTDENLQVELLYRNHTTGLEQALVERGSHAGRSWLELSRWDTQDVSGVAGRPDGRFDFLPMVTYLPETGTLFFPSRHPFVTIAEEGGLEPFATLYTESPYQAAQARALDQFVIRVKVSGSGQSELVSLGSTQLIPGTVKLFANGRALVEGSDFKVNYATGQLSLAPTTHGARIEVVIQDPEVQRAKEKTLLGAEAYWQLARGLSFGASIYDYSEQSQRDRIRWGEETLHNTAWGLHLRYDRTSRHWSDRLNELIGTDLQEPIAVRAEMAYAQLQSRFQKAHNGREEIILDDFEQGQAVIELTHPISWQLGSDPFPLVHSGGRAQMAWFTVDPLLVREGAEHQPHHLRSDTALRQDPLVREFYTDQFFPQQDQNPHQSSIMPLLNLSFYPEERGPYNIDADQMGADGKMRDPSSMWGSMMRPLEVQDLEATRFAYIELWLLDPYYHTEGHPSGEGSLVIDLGRFSEEIIPDGVLAYEGVFGEQYGFDRTGAVSMEVQDVGLDGLSSAEEVTSERYSHYLQRVEAITNFHPWTSDPLARLSHPRVDPAGDDYRFYLGDEWDQLEASILQRYKYINGMEGNSLDQLIQGVQSASTWLPDVEDLNRDQVLQEAESYFRYRVSLSREALQVGQPFVVGERVMLPDSYRGLEQEVRWVKVRIPLREPTEEVGTHPSLQQVEAIRLTLTGFTEETHLRLARFRMVSTPWSVYTQPITFDQPSALPQQATLSLSTLSLEEDGGRRPIPYLSPPGMEREQVQMALVPVREDERALSLQIEGLQSGEAVAVYKEVQMDLRHFERLDLFTHLEAPLPLQAGEVELFIRLGHDYTNHYYEVSLPLHATPVQDYSDMGVAHLAHLIWPVDNRLQLELSHLTALKARYLAEVGQGAGLERYSIPHPEWAERTLTIKGNPSLGEVTAMMIGVRSKSGRAVPLQIEVWVNELMAIGAKELGGAAFTLDGEVRLGEVAQIQWHGRQESAGFGALGHDPRRGVMEDLKSWQVSGRLEVGELLGQGAHLHAPLYYHWQWERAMPKYAPESNDLLYNEWEKVVAQSRGYRSGEQRSEWRLEDWHLKPTTGRTSRLFDWSNLRATYHLSDRTAFSPEVKALRDRRALVLLGYHYERATGADHLRLQSRWYRSYQEMQYGASEEKSNRPLLGTLQSRWDWNRSLQLQWTLLPGLRFAWHSQTTALIKEPFEELHRTGEEVRFRWMTREILESITRLGETMHYHGSLDLTYRLPQWKQKGWQGLSGSATWRSLYEWQRGATYQNVQTGHTVRNNGLLSFAMQYNFTPLFQAGKHPFIHYLSLRYDRNWGSTLPGWLPSSGKAFGIGREGRVMAPTIGYMVAVGSLEKQLRGAVQRGWIGNQVGSWRYLSYFIKNEFSGQLRLQPFSLLTLDLDFRYQNHDTREIDPKAPDRLSKRGGTLYFSTVGLYRFFHGAQEVCDLSGADGFLKRYTLTSGLKDDLPRFSTLLPNWRASLHLHRLLARGSWLYRHLSEVKLSHHYRGSLEVPQYVMRSDREINLQSLVQRDEMNPVIGVEVKTKWGLSLEERWIRRRHHTLLLDTDRLIEQRDDELFTKVGYQLSFAPLWRSHWKLLRSYQQSIGLHFSYSTIRTEVLQHLLREGLLSATQGLHTQYLRSSIEYRLSDAISLRGFYEEERRRPLVSNYTHPIRRISYGLLMEVHLSL